MGTRKRKLAPLPILPRATADTWVARNEDGQLHAVKVVDMTDGHLVRWVQYFRRKLRESGLDWPDSKLDALLRNDHVTAPAIFEALAVRGLSVPPTVATEPLAQFLDSLQIRPAAGQDLATIAGQATLHCVTCGQVMQREELQMLWRCPTGHVLTMRALAAMRPAAPEPEPGPRVTRKIDLDG